MVVMTSLMKSPIISPNNQNVLLVALQVNKHEIYKVEQISVSGSCDT